jgi:ferrochelatase
MTPEKTGVLLLNLGGPDCLDAIEPFLYRLFSDPDIIRLPFSWLMQKPLAWLIAVTRAPEVKHLYADIGGRSPIVPLTEAQRDALVAKLHEQGVAVSGYIGMRYWHPLIPDAVDRMLADGVTRFVLLPLYPQYSLTTTGSSLKEFYRALTQKLGHAPAGLEISEVPPFYDEPDYLAALAGTIRDALETHPWTCPLHQVQILFSAHSLPKKFVKKTGDPYPVQTYETARRVMAEYFPENPWELSYQSKVGPIPWLGPPTDGVLHFFAANQVRNALIVPISFVSDHLETLQEIDVQFLPLGRSLGIEQCHRAKSFNDDPRFIALLADKVRACLEKPTTAEVS